MKRVTRVMSMYQFVLAMVLALYVGFSRLNHLRFLERACAALPPGVKSVYARADSGFYCGEAVEAYEGRGCQFIISARKTARLVDELKADGVEALTAHGCRRPVRFSLSAARMGESLSVHCPTLRKEAPAEGGGRAGAVRTIRDGGLYLSGLRHQPEAGGGPAGVVLQSTGGSREPDQRSQ